MAARGTGAAGHARGRSIERHRSEMTDGDRAVRRSSPGRPETHQDNQRAAHLIGESGPKELGGDQRINQPMSESGQTRPFDRAPITSDLPR